MLFVRAASSWVRNRGADPYAALRNGNVNSNHNNCHLLHSIAWANSTQETETETKCALQRRTHTHTHSQSQQVSLSLRVILHNLVLLISPGLISLSHCFLSNFHHSLCFLHLCASMDKCMCKCANVWVCVLSLVCHVHSWRLSEVQTNA